MGKDKGLVFGQGNGFPELDRKARNRKLYKRRGYKEHGSHEQTDNVRQ